MTPEQLKQLRKDLNCSARELAATLDAPLSEVQAWESGERFPTKRVVLRLNELATKGPSGIQRAPTHSLAGAQSQVERLADPEFWGLVRKLAAHESLFRDALKLACAFEDPIK